MLFPSHTFQDASNLSVELSCQVEISLRDLSEFISLELCRHVMQCLETHPRLWMRAWQAKQCGWMQSSRDLIKLFLKHVPTGACP